MKSTRTQKIRLGLFLLAAVGLLLVGLVTLGGVRLLASHDEYHLFFRRSVSGLQVGAPVRVLGVDVGSVTSIGLDPKTERVRVDVSVAEGTPLHADAIARLDIVGLTGMKSVEIDPGTPSVPLLEPGTAIQVGEGGMLFGMRGDADDLVGELRETLARLNLLLSDENRRSVSRLLESVANASVELERSLRDNRESLGSLLAATVDALREMQAMFADARAVVADVRPLTASLTRLVRSADDKLAAVPVERMVQRVDALLTEMNQAVESLDLEATAERFATLAVTAERTLGQVDRVVERSAGDLRSLFGTLRRASTEFEQFVREIRSQPNVLIRGRGRSTP